MCSSSASAPFGRMRETFAILLEARPCSIAELPHEGTCLRRAGTNQVKRRVGIHPHLCKHVSFCRPIQQLHEGVVWFVHDYRETLRKLWLREILRVRRARYDGRIVSSGPCWRISRIFRRCCVQGITEDCSDKYRRQDSLPCDS